MTDRRVTAAGEFMIIHSVYADSPNYDLIMSAFEFGYDTGKGQGLIAGLEVGRREGRQDGRKEGIEESIEILKEQAMLADR